MKIQKTKVSYDPDADVLAFESSPVTRIDYARELGNFVIHFTKDGRPVSIEVLEASKMFSKNPKSLRQIEMAFA